MAYSAAATPTTSSNTPSTFGASSTAVSKMTVTSASPSSPVSSHRSRTKLLNRLGYFQAPPPNARRYGGNGRLAAAGRVGRASTSASSAYAFSSVSLLGSVRPTTLMKLKYDDDGNHEDSSNDNDVHEGVTTTTTTTDDRHDNNNNNDNNMNDGNDDHRCQQHNACLSSTSPTSTTADEVFVGAMSNTTLSSSSSSSRPPSSTTMSSSSSNTITNDDNNPHSVRFHDVVTVVSIPSRHQFSNRIKGVLWSNRHELSEMTQRNIFEFQSEGWDWTTVVEDDDMYVDSVTGEKVHPCHFDLEEEGTTSLDDEQNQGERNRQDEEEAGGCNGDNVVDPNQEDDEDEDDEFVFRPLERRQSTSYR